MDAPFLSAKLYTLGIKELSQGGSLGAVSAFIASCQDTGNGPLIGLTASHLLLLQPDSH